MKTAETRKSLRSTGILSLTALALATLSYPRQGAAQTQHYTQTNLVSAKSGAAAVTDPNLVNPWGVSRASAGPWWVADEATGLSTLYSGTGAIDSLVVTIPPAKSTTKTGSPTGTVYNGGTGFQLTTGKPALFLFVTLDGTISGWNSGTKAVIKVNEKGKSIYTGATIATNTVPDAGVESFLYVADVEQAKVQVFNSSFVSVTEPAGAFVDPDIPAGYTPFNVQNIGGNIFVAFAEQNSAKDFVNFGAGLGYVSIFTPGGTFLHRLKTGSYFNAPWGLALASGDFGIYSHDILVGQFGNGEIRAFDPDTFTEKGALLDSKGSAIAISGLWALSFGNGNGAGSATALYFTASDDEGLFGTITPVENVQGNDQ